MRSDQQPKSPRIVAEIISSGGLRHHLLGSSDARLLTRSAQHRRLRFLRRSPSHASRRAPAARRQRSRPRVDPSARSSRYQGSTRSAIDGLPPEPPGRRSGRSQARRQAEAHRTRRRETVDARIKGEAGPGLGDDLDTEVGNNTSRANIPTDGSTPENEFWKPLDHPVAKAADHPWLQLYGATQPRPREHTTVRSLRSA